MKILKFHLKKWKMKKREREYVWFLSSPAITKIEMRKVSILLDIVVEAFIKNLEMIKFLQIYYFIPPFLSPASELAC